MDIQSLNETRFIWENGRLWRIFFERDRATSVFQGKRRIADDDPSWPPRKLKQGLPTFLEGESELQVAEEKSSMNNKVEEFIETNDPVLSVDCKNKGRLGNYSNTEIMTGKIIA